MIRFRWMQPFLWAAALLTPPAFAQEAVHPLAPVDQAVGDLDPLSTSLRRVEPGLGQFSARAALRPLVAQPEGPSGPWRVDPRTGALMSQGYVYEAPGVRAFVQQPAYRVLTPEGVGRNVAPLMDEAYQPVAGANIVYDLVPRGEHVLDPSVTDPGWTDPRIGTRLQSVRLQRIDTRIHGRVPWEGTGNRTLHAPPSSAAEPLPREIPLQLPPPADAVPAEQP